MAGNVEARKNKGHSIGLTSTAIADKFNPTLFNNAFDFGFYNKKLDFHQFNKSNSDVTSMT